MCIAFVTFLCKLVKYVKFDKKIFIFVYKLNVDFMELN